MSLVTSALFLALLSFVLRKAYQWFTRISVAHLPGPKPGSTILGNLSQLASGQSGEVEFKWQAQFGDVIRIKGLFGEDRILLSDPKAIQYIIQTSGYNFPKIPERREVARLVSGKGLLWAEGNVHKRQRKIMLPGFSATEAKRYLPAFTSYAIKLCDKWKDMILSADDQSTVLDIPFWASRCTLDAIGEVAFDYEFGSLDDADNALGQAFSNLLFDTCGKLTDAQIFTQNIIAYIPARLTEFLGDNLPSKKLLHARETAKLSTAVGKDLVAQKMDAHLKGIEKHDILSLLIKANLSENHSSRLSEEELLGVMRLVILAGHETTANTFSWMLHELSRHPDMQTKLRKEILEMRRTIEARGDSSYTPADLDSMSYLNAVLKETLRYHSVAVNLVRQAGQDDVLPLSKPIITTSGEVIHELEIPKGIKIMTSVGAYNRNKEIFGQDAHLFNPERWLNAGVNKTSSVGVLGNLLTFSGGVRSCIGWKFAMLELQAFTFELVGSFEYMPTPESQKIRRESAIVMVPVVEGQVEKGAQLPLRIRVASDEA